MAEDLFQETVHKVAAPTHFYAYILNDSGNFLAVDDEGVLRTLGYADDQVIWDDAGDGYYEHVVSKQRVRLDGQRAFLDGEALGRDGATSGDAAAFCVERGPQKLPSEYLRFFQENGWVCLTAILPDEILEGLEKVSGTDRYADRQFDRKQQPFNQTSAMARTAAEPVSLWLMRQYMQTNEIRLGHTPSLAILGKDDGERDVQGWHSDFPYLWGIAGRMTAASKRGRVPTPSGQTVLGIQRNVCISPFTKVGGATAFKLGSHARDEGPPEAWGNGNAYGQPGYRAKHGLPYNGPEADIIEAPGGSIILYDARTWHRAGVNRTEHKRSAMLQAMIPMYCMPFFDTSQAYKDFVKSDVYDELTDREKEEIQSLMVHHIVGPGGKHAITVDEELSRMMRESGETAGATGY